MKKNHTETEKKMISVIKDNIIYYSYKNEILRIYEPIIGEEEIYAMMDDNYLSSYSLLMDEIYTEEDSLNKANDQIFTQLLDIFDDNVSEQPFKDFVWMGSEEVTDLAAKIYNEWQIALKAIRNTYKIKKTL